MFIETPKQFDDLRSVVAIHNDYSTAEPFVKASCFAHACCLNLLSGLLLFQRLATRSQFAPGLSLTFVLDEWEQGKHDLRIQKVGDRYR